MVVKNMNIDYNVYTKIQYKDKDKSIIYGTFVYQERLQFVDMEFKRQFNMFSDILHRFYLAVLT